MAQTTFHTASMKMHHQIKWLALLLVFAAGCKRETTVSPEYAQAYARFVVIDGPGSGKVQFYLDGKVNSNGDSVLHNPDGTIYQPDPAQNTTSTINYPSGGWTDNSPINFAGTYGFSNLPPSNYSIFPNMSDRVQLAPIINNYNYYNWAALPATSHKLAFYSVVNASLFGNPITVRGDQILNQTINLEGGTLQTFLLVNKAVCKLYVPIENNNYASNLPIYSMNEQVSYFSNQFDFVTIKDHPDKLPAFKDSSAYIRFMNVTPTYADQSVNQNTESIDVYIAPLYGLRPDIYSIFGTEQLIDSIGTEIPVVKGLERYQSAVDAPFFEVNLADNMRTDKKTGRPDTVTTATHHVPRYYRVLVYRAGQSAATGAAPLAQGDWLATFNRFPGYSYAYPVAPTGFDQVDTWLLRSDGTNYHPAICTIPIAVSDQIFFGPNSTGASYYLGFRSCIDYQKVGVNAVFFNNDKK